ncbi:MAG: serine hydrolase domain-containing protein [bacterium]|nr:serine hydrolase domain-containing protein [bacterium]
MKTMLRVLLVLLLFTLTPVAVSPQDDVDGALEALLEDIAPADGPAVAVRITKGDETWAAAGGLADIENGTPASPDDRFRIGSISKSFVAVALLQLADEEVVSLDDALTDWLDEDLIAGIENAESATVGQLVTMTSGIAEYLNETFFEVILEDPTYEWTAPEVLDYARDLEASFAPGEGYEYSNTNYILLQLVIEAATEQPLHQVVREGILDPLGLENTYTQISETLPGEFIHGYEDIDGDGTLDDVGGYNDGAGLGDGALISTTADLTRFYQGLLVEEALLSDESLELMSTDEAGSEYGMGLEVIETDYGTVYGHTGAVFGFSSAAFYAPDLDVTVVILYGSSALDITHVAALFEIAAGI